MKLNTIISGAEHAGPPVILAHGVFGSARNLGGIARQLDDSRKVVSVDMRNHGESGWDPDHSYAAMAGDLAEVIADHGGIADVVGHSMGGKAAMALALTRPDLVRRLVVLDIAPYSYGHSKDSLIARMQGLDLNGLKLRSEADERLSETIKDPGVRAFLLQSLDLRSDPVGWQINLDVLSDQMDEITGWPEALSAGRFEGPVLTIAGSDSDYVAPGPAEDALFHVFPQAELTRIAGTGHWLHAEKPKEVSQAVAQFLNL